MMNALLIEHLHPSRWNEYRDLRLEALQTAPQAFLDTIEEANARSKSDWIARQKNMLFAQVDGKLVGMVGWYQEPRAKLSHVASIVSLYVSPSYRKQKIAKFLMKRALENIRKNPSIKVVHLGVIDSQKEAEKLYTSLGFTKVGTLHQALMVDDVSYDEHIMEMLI